MTNTATNADADADEWEEPLRNAEAEADEAWEYLHR